MTIFFFWSSVSYGHRIGIEEVSSLIFPPAGPGDDAYTVPPGNFETSHNGSFLVSGRKHSAYIIVIPVKVIFMKHERNPLEFILIKKFRSTPAEGANGYLNSQGKQMIYVGATRNKLKKSQKPGTYRGHFWVTVVY